MNFLKQKLLIGFFFCFSFFLLAKEADKGAKLLESRFEKGNLPFI